MFFEKSKKIWKMKKSHFFWKIKKLFILPFLEINSISSQSSQSGSDDFADENLMVPEQDGQMDVTDWVIFVDWLKDIVCFPNRKIIRAGLESGPNLANRATRAPRTHRIWFWWFLKKSIFEIFHFWKFSFFSARRLTSKIFWGLFHVRFLDSDNIFEKHCKFYTKAIFLVSKVVLNSKISEVYKKYFLHTSERSFFN